MSRFTSAFLLLSSLAISVLRPDPASASASIRIIDADLPGVGLNDPTVVGPVGGNTGTTLGEQRMIVLERAAAIWANALTSPIEIRIDVSFTSLPCDSLGGILGNGAPISVYRNFDGATYRNTWYPSALADRLSGRDQAAGQSDIRLQLNGDLDGSSCLGPVSWYLGLDGQDGDDIDLLAIALHEIGHGLGFSNTVDLDTGAMLNGTPDVFSLFVLDSPSGLHWSEMTNAQRVDASIHTAEVVWDGAAVTAHASEFLSLPGIVRVDSPPALAADLEFARAIYGPQLALPGISGPLVLVDDGDATTTDACTPILNASEVAGKIALIDRGTCNFIDKTQAAQAAGAIAAVIVSNSADPLPTMTGTDPGITIPTVLITQDAGTAIKAELGTGVTMTLTADPAEPPQGADTTGHVLLYAPEPSAVGISIIHWDDFAIPNLLMEPYDLPDARGGTDSRALLDLTPYLLEDIGWVSGGGSGSGSASLESCGPNPFGDATTIRFIVAAAGDLDISIYDLQGRVVRRVVHGPARVGNFQATWDGTDANGRRARQGVYFCRLRLGGTDQMRRVVRVQ